MNYPHLYMANLQALCLPQRILPSRHLALVDLPCELPDSSRNQILELRSSQVFALNPVEVFWG